MASKSELFSASKPGESRLSGLATRHKSSRIRRNLLEITIVFFSIVIAVWTPPGHAQLFVSLLATACVLVFAMAGKWSPSELGLTQPVTGAVRILFAGALACGVIALIGILLRSVGPGYNVSLSRSWQYAIWALEQEFILQSIFFVRLEEVVGSRQAVILSAVLFALVHIPSPILMLLSFAGGILFCELFREWRNLYPLGVIHAALGLTIAASFPDKWMHHMRVGIGYLMYH
jgi:membrane protease YdiL (CAAX protease family)